MFSSTVPTLVHFCGSDQTRNTHHNYNFKYEAKLITLEINDSNKSMLTPYVLFYYFNLFKCSNKCAC